MVRQQAPEITGGTETVTVTVIAVGEAGDPGEITPPRMEVARGPPVETAREEAAKVTGEEAAAKVMTVGA